MAGEQTNIPIYGTGANAGKLEGYAPTGSQPYFLPNTSSSANPNNSQWSGGSDWKGTPTLGGSGQNNLRYDPNTGLPLPFGKSVPFTGSMPTTNLTSNITSPVLPTQPTGSASDYNKYLTGGVTDTSQTPKTGLSTENELFSLLGYAPQPTDLASGYKTLEDQSGVVGKENARNQYQNQLNSIIAKSQADQLSVTGQGRGVPEAIIGGQQAQIAKEAAIQALPVQAALSAAQGDLETAQKHLDTMFSIFQQDAQNQYSYKKDLFNAVVNIATKDQDRQLALADKANDRAYAEKQANLAQAAQLTTYALEQHAPASIISAISTEANRPGASIASVTNAAGKYGMDTLRQANLANIYSEINARQIAQSSNNGSVSLLDNKGNAVNIPTNVAPYYNTSSSGVGYIDASTLQGTAKEKTQIINQAQAAGLKVITNKNTAADLVNIKDANDKLGNIQTILSGIAQPGWITRSLYGLGLTKLAVATQSDPQKAAAGALSSVGLDILKAISGVQGFRGNQSAIQQVTDHLPKITDTVDVVNQKINYVQKLIDSRENAIVGNSSTATNNKTYTVGGVTYSQHSDGLYYPN